MKVVWLVIADQSAMYDSMVGPITVDASPDETLARQFAEKQATADPGVAYGLFAMLGRVRCGLCRHYPSGRKSDATSADGRGTIRGVLRADHLVWADGAGPEDGGGILDDEGLQCW